MQERDVQIVEAVHRHRVLTTEHIATLFFSTASGGVSSSCLSRLRNLVRAGFLERGEQLQAKTDGRRPYLYMMTSAGCELLQAQLGYEETDIDWKPSYNDVQWMFLAHQLAINDVYVALARAVEPIGWRLDQWIDDRILKQNAPRVPLPGTGELVAVVPDAYFALVGPGGSPKLQFFLERDRGTVTVGGGWKDCILDPPDPGLSSLLCVRRDPRAVWNQSHTRAVSDYRRAALGKPETVDRGGRRPQTVLVYNA